MEILDCSVHFFRGPWLGKTKHMSQQKCWLRFQDLINLFFSLLFSDRFPIMVNTSRQSFVSRCAVYDTRFQVSDVSVWPRAWLWWSKEKLWILGIILLFLLSLDLLNSTPVYCIMKNYLLKSLITWLFRFLQIFFSLCQV